MTNLTRQALFQLLRIALGQENDFSWMPDADLKSVIALAKEQGVSCVACDGLKLIYEKSESDETVMRSLSALNSKECELLKFSWLGESLKAERSYTHYLQDLLKLVNFLSTNGIRSMVLKGYGLSLNYPVPAHRPMGDIDLYLFGDAEKADSLVKGQLGISHLPNEPHHSVFPFGNCMVENHHAILNIYKHPSNRKLETILEELAKEAKTVQIEGETIYFPSVKFNSLHLLRHMASDFATVNTTLRHILDWCTFVRANAEMMDWAFLQNIAKDSKMNRFLDAINSICIDYLGCSSGMFPVMERDVLLRDKVLNEILNPSWGEEIPSRSHFVTYGWKKVKRMFSNRWKYQIVFDEKLVFSLMWAVKNRINKTLKCFTK